MATHMIRNPKATFCGLPTDHAVCACPDPGCQEHAPLIDCPDCDTRPLAWDYMIAHALKAAGKDIVYPGLAPVLTGAISPWGEWVQDEAPLNVRS